MPETLVRLLAHLDRTATPHVLLDRYDDIVAGRSSAIEVLVDPRHQASLLDSAIEFMDGNGHSPAQTVREPARTLLVWTEGPVKIDCRTHLDGPGGRMLSGEGFLKRRVRRETTHVLCEEDRAIRDALRDGSPGAAIDEFVRRHSVAGPLGGLKKAAFYLKAWLRSTPEPLVVLHGTDGVGKSTVLDCMKSQLDRSGIEYVSFHAGGKRGGLLPSRKSATAATTATRKNSMPYDLARFLYHMVDFYYTYLTRIYRQRLCGRKVILDKYFSYILRYKEPTLEFNIPRFVISFFYALSPKPGVFVLLWHDPPEVVRRKQERTEAEVVDDTAFLEGLGKKSRVFFKVKTDREPELVGRHILEEIDRRWYERRT